MKRGVWPKVRPNFGLRLLPGLFSCSSQDECLSAAAEAACFQLYVNTLDKPPHHPPVSACEQSPKGFKSVLFFFSSDSTEEFRDELLTARDQKENSLLA